MHVGRTAAKDCSSKSTYKGTNRMYTVTVTELYLQCLIQEAYMSRLVMQS